LSGDVQLRVNDGEPVDRAGFFDWYEKVYQSPTTDPTNKDKESNMNINDVTCANPKCEGSSGGGQFDPVSFADDWLCVCRDCGSLAGLPYLATSLQQPATPPAATPLEGTWTKLRSDNWGARICVREEYPVAAGTRARLLRKNGKEDLMCIDTVVARFEDRDHPGWFIVLAEVSRA
tara:strand:- start:305 stop:832 length:528 start_codon:yes stop_codon:yes gene_type:complete